MAKPGLSMGAPKVGVPSIFSFLRKHVEWGADSHILYG